MMDGNGQRTTDINGQRTTTDGGQQRMATTKTTRMDDNYADNGATRRSTFASFATMACIREKKKKKKFFYFVFLKKKSLLLLLLLPELLQGQLTT
jgi:hypothetical protein